MKLGKEKAQAVDEAEGGFELIEPQLLVGKLNEVKTGDGDKGPYWIWEFEVPEDQDAYRGRKFWNNTSLSEAAYWKLKETFEAFGVSADTDTEDLIGKRVLLDIGQRTIQKGARAGELANTVKSVLALTVDSPDAVTGAGAKKKGADPLF